MQTLRKGLYRVTFVAKVLNRITSFAIILYIYSVCLNIPNKYAYTYIFHMHYDLSTLEYFTQKVVLPSGAPPIELCRSCSYQTLHGQSHKLSLIHKGLLKGFLLCPSESSVMMYHCETGFQVDPFCEPSTHKFMKNP